jgi:hypothetical protein
MSQKRYTERDIQTFLDGNFSGDVLDFERFIEEDPDAKVKLELYTSLFALIRKQQRESYLPTDFPETTIASIEANKKRKDEWLVSMVPVVILTSLALASVLYFVNTIFYYVDSILALITALAVGVTVWLFARVEVAEKRRLYDSK